MGDVSNEPSMEEILSSIKRIIAEEGDAAIAARPRRAARPAARDDAEEILELSDPVPEVAEVPASPLKQKPGQKAQEKPLAMGSPSPAQAAGAAGAAAPTAETILSDRTAQATRGTLEALSRMVVKPDVSGSDTLEGLVRELLKPMLREWLDTNLPQIVESMVQREISRITDRN